MMLAIADEARHYLNSPGVSGRSDSPGRFSHFVLGAEEYVPSRAASRHHEDVGYCELCEMDRAFCVHGQGDRRKAATVAVGKLLISPNGMAHFEGCPHKGDDQDYKR